MSVDLQPVEDLLEWLERYGVRCKSVGGRDHFLSVNMGRVSGCENGVTLGPRSYFALLKH